MTLSHQFQFLISAVRLPAESYSRPSVGQGDEARCGKPRTHSGSIATAGNFPVSVYSVALNDEPVALVSPLNDPRIRVLGVRHNELRTSVAGTTNGEAARLLDPLGNLSAWRNDRRTTTQIVPSIGRPYGRTDTAAKGYEANRSSVARDGRGANGKQTGHAGSNPAALTNLGANPIAPTAAKTWQTTAQASAATQDAAAGTLSGLMAPTWLGHTGRQQGGLITPVRSAAENHPYDRGLTTALRPSENSVRSSAAGARQGSVPAKLSALAGSQRQADRQAVHRLPLHPRWAAFEYRGSAIPDPHAFDVEVISPATNPPAN